MSRVPSDNQARSPWPFVFQFRLAHLFYAIALVGSTLATFGSDAILLAAVLSGFWTYVFCRRSRPRGLLEGLLVLLAMFCLHSVWWAIDPPHEASRRSYCANNLKCIALALQNYHDVHGTFPPAYVADEHGQPMHSWRVLILPWMQELDVYDNYHFDEPWDGPRNRRLWNRIWDDFYLCPSDPRRVEGQRKWTSYVAVRGPRTMWPDAQSRKLNDIPDGAANTVMVVEDQRGQIAWMEPRDLEFEEALRLFTSPDPQSAGLHRDESFFFETYRGRHVVCADGSVQFVHHGVKPEVWSALLTIDDGAKIADLDLRGTGKEFRRVKLGNCFRLAVFVFLVVLPLPWVWRRRK